MDGLLPFVKDHLAGDGGGALRIAAALVEEAMRTLNTNAAACECCGLTVAENWKEKKIHERLRALPKKLRGLATEIERTMCNECGDPLGRGENQTCAECRAALAEGA